MQIKQLKYPLFILAVIIYYACEQSSCIQILDNTAKIKFYSSEEKKDTTIDWLTVYGLDMDSLLCDNESDTSQLHLPLSPNADVSTFILKINYIDTILIDSVFKEDGSLDHVNKDTLFYNVPDTISLKYSRLEEFISPECGFVMNFKLEELTNTTNNLDSIIIIAKDSLINTNNAQHFEIYF